MHGGGVFQACPGARVVRCPLHAMHDDPSMLRAAAAYLEQRGPNLEIEAVEFVQELPESAVAGH